MHALAVDSANTHTDMHTHPTDSIVYVLIDLQTLLPSPSARSFAFGMRSNEHTHHTPNHPPTHTDWQVVVSAVLTVPCMYGMIYLMALQHEILKLERILCALMLCLHVTELVYAIKFAFSTCRPVTYT